MINSDKYMLDKSFQKNIYWIDNCINEGGVNKSVLNLGHKNKYVLHYKNLQLHLLLGMKLVNVHRIFKF